MKDFSKIWLIFSVVVLACFAMSPDVQAQRIAYGGLYVVDGSTAQSLSTTAAKMTGFTAVTEATSGDVSVVPSAANDNVALLANGVYLIHLDVTASIDTADIEVTYALRDGTTAITGAECRHEGEAAGVPSNASLTWIYNPTAAGTLNVYVESESGTPDVTPIDAQLVVVRLR